MTEGPPPPGWYEDDQGVVRWFDGAAWTDHVQAVAKPAQPAAPAIDEDDPLWGDAAEATAAASVATSTRHRATGRTEDVPTARRPWFWVALLALVLVVGTGGAFALTRGSDDDASPVTAPSSAPAPSPSVTSSPSSGATSSPSATPTTGLVEGDWTVISYRFQDNGIGDFGGTARITYTGSEAAGGAGNFTFTVFKGGKQVATLVGSVLDARPGQTKATDLISTDRYRPGPYSAVRFRKDL